MAKKRHYERRTVMDIEYQGHGIIKPEGRVVFVEGVLPGEVVDVQETRRKRDHAFGNVTAFHHTSPERTEPFCRHFADCGGCTWQYLPYPRQLHYKGRFVADILRRIGHIESPEPLPILGCTTDQHYRNKLDYSFSPTRWLTPDEVESSGANLDRRALGFHVKGRFNRVIDVTECYLQPDPSNSIRDQARRIAVERGLTFHDPAAHEGLLRSLIIRTSRSGEAMVILVIYEPNHREAVSFLEQLADAVPRISSRYYVVNPSRNDDIGPHEPVHVAGTRTITERCGALSFAIGPKSFYQTNSAQAERLYQVVRDWAALDGRQTLLDLYCGIGSIGLFLASDAHRVVGVEAVEEAVNAARANAAANAISNAEFHAGDVRELLPRLSERSFDLVVVDPPRAGMHPEVLLALIRMQVPRIIYVSCKPSTQARDLAVLREEYEIERVQPVDMFPQTFHIENVVALRRRQ